MRRTPGTRATTRFCRSRRRASAAKTAIDRQGGGSRVNAAMVQIRLDMLRIEHRDLDTAIDALAITAVPDQMQMARLKKRKLRLRDEIAQIEDGLVPDLIA